MRATRQRTGPRPDRGRRAPPGLRDRPLARGRLPVEQLISARSGLSAVNEAMDALAEGKALRQLILFDGDEAVEHPTEGEPRT